MNLGIFGKYITISSRRIKATRGNESEVRSHTLRIPSSASSLPAAKVAPPARKLE